MYPIDGPDDDYDFDDGMVDHDEEDRRAFEEEQIEEHLFSRKSRRRELPPDEIDDTDQHNPVDMSKEDWLDFYAENPDYEDMEP